MRGARQLRPIMARQGFRLNSPKLTLLMASGMVGDLGAIKATAAELGCDERVARRLLLDWRHATIELAMSEGYKELAEALLRKGY